MLECVVGVVIPIPPAPRSIRYAGAIGCAVAILYASAIEPGDGIPRTLFGIGFSVYLHLLAYAGFVGAIGYSTLSADRRTLLAAAALATLYGVGIELLQGTIPYRTMSTADALINTTGATAGAVCWWLLAPWFGADRGDRSSSPL